MSNKDFFGKNAKHEIHPDGSSYTGPFGTISIDLQLPGLRVHDGQTCGGIMTIEGTPTAAAIASAKSVKVAAAVATKVLSVEKVSK